MLAVLWILLLAPGLESAALRWRLAPLAIVVVGVIGLWFAFNGTNSLTWIFARQTAPYVLALALALRLRRPRRHGLPRHDCRSALRGRHLGASVSYTIDLALFGRAVDAELAPLSADAASAPRLAESDRRRRRPAHIGPHLLQMG